MAELGIDVGRNLAISNEKILGLGVNWVRFPITRDANPDELTDRIAFLARRRVKTCVVIDNSARGEMTNEEAAAFYVGTYDGVVEAFEVGNEYDADWDFTTPDKSAEGRRNRRKERNGPDWEDPSWIMDPPEISALVRAFRDANPTSEIWAGGLVCGQPQFLDSPDLDLGPADRIAVHPYDKEGPAAAALIRDYAAKVAGLPWDKTFLRHPHIVVTEYGWISDPNLDGSEDDQSLKLLGLATALAEHDDLHAAILFCYDNDQDVGGFGLIAGGREKAAFATFQRFATMRDGASALVEA